MQFDSTGPHSTRARHERFEDLNLSIPASLPECGGCQRKRHRPCDRCRL